MNKKGQALVLFVILLPILGVLFTYIFDSAVIIKENSRLKSIAKSAIIYMNENKTASQVKEMILKNDKNIEIVEMGKDRIHLKNNINPVFGSLVGYKDYSLDATIYGYYKKGQLNTADSPEELAEDLKECFTFTETYVNGVYGAEVKDYDISCGTDVIIPSKISMAYTEKTFNLEKCYIYAKGDSEELEDYQKEECNELKEYYESGQAGSAEIKELESYDVFDYGKTITKTLDVISIYGAYAFWSTGTGIDGYVEGAFLQKPVTNVALPNTLLKIGDASFAGASLTSIDLPDSIIYIGADAFGDNDLTTVTMPKNLIELKLSAFYMNQIKSLDFSKSTNLKIIGESVFEKNQLEGTIIIPSTVEEIKEDAFEISAGYYNDKIAKIVNPTGRAFNWEKIFGGYNTVDPYITGTYSYHDYSDNTDHIIEIVDSLE